MGLVLMAIGGFVALFGSVWYIVTMFKTGIAWGCLALLFPIVQLIWLIPYWKEGKKPLALYLAGLLLLILGASLGGWEQLEAL